MKSIGQNTVISQCLSLLPMDDFRCPLMDYGNYKLKTDSLLKIFVAAQLDGWSSYADIEERLRANPDLCKELRITDISGSQLSRRINNLPTELVQKLFFKVATKLKRVTQQEKGISSEIGRLHIIDSTYVKLPQQLCDWAYISNGLHAVKMHTRLVVTSVDTAFPDKIVPSTGYVSDYEGSDHLIETADATYVMDRGYGSIKRMEDWVESRINFVVRINKNIRTYTLEEYKPTHPSVLKDAKVEFGTTKNPIRLVEFMDEQQRLFRIMTTRWDLSDQQIMDIYKHRWMIELFFKWVKQHLKLTKIMSTKPQGIWNQMFLGLIAFGLSLLVQKLTKTKKTQWELLRVLKTYLYKPWDLLINELNRKKKKTSKGRQKVPIPKKQAEFVGSVAVIKLKKNKK